MFVIGKIQNKVKFRKLYYHFKVMKCSCKRTAVRLEKDYRQRSARHKLKKHNKMADEVRELLKYGEILTHYLFFEFTFLYKHILSIIFSF